MSVIVPTITAVNAHIYRKQLERVSAFAKRIHLDFADKDFTSVELLSLEQAWRPDGMEVDLHLMYKRPTEELSKAINLKPDLIILQAESDGKFMHLAGIIRDAGIKVGIALLPETPAAVITPILNIVDHVLIFSGHLGHFGGRANMSLLGKISEIKDAK